MPFLSKKNLRETIRIVPWCLLILSPFILIQWATGIPILKAIGNTFIGAAVLLVVSFLGALIVLPLSSFHRYIIKIVNSEGKQSHETFSIIYQGCGTILALIGLYFTVHGLANLIDKSEWGVLIPIGVVFIFYIYFLYVKIIHGDHKNVRNQ
jgi:hypothetical protein